MNKMISESDQKSVQPMRMLQWRVHRKHEEEKANQLHKILGSRPRQRHIITH